MKACAVTVSLLLAASADLKALSDTGYRFSSWSTDQGLPQNTVQSIAQTGDGYLWLGTRFGLVRFDGMHFTIFDRKNTPEFLSDDCVALAVDGDDNLWIGTPHGLLRKNHRKFTAYSVDDGLCHYSILSLCAGRDGSVWIGTEDGINRFKGEKLEIGIKQVGAYWNQAMSLSEDREGVLWIGTHEGLKHLDPKTSKLLAVTQTTESKFYRPVYCLAADRERNVWFGSWSGLHQFAQGRITTYSKDHGLPANRVQFISEDREGRLWVGTEGGGLTCFKNGTPRDYSSGDGLSDDFVLSFLQDREGDLWIGTLFGGLNRMQPRRFRTFSKKDAPQYDNVWSICAGQNGGVWIATDGGLAQWIGENFKSLPQIGDLPDQRLRSVLEDRQENLWVGTLGFGVIELQNGQVRRYDSSNGLLSDNVRALYEGRDGALWIGTEHGVNRLKENQLTGFAAKEGLSGADVRVIHEDCSGTVWIGTYDGGLNWLKDGKIGSYTVTNGLSSNQAWAIHEDEQGTLWIATANGLNRLKSGRLNYFTTRHGLFDNVINHILEDKSGDLWLSCNRGIYRVSKQALDDIAEGKTNMVNCVSYGASDGMLSSETNGENQPAGCVTSDGRLWFPTTKGVVMIDPENLFTNESAPPVVIEDVLIDNHPFDPARNAKLPPGHGHIVELHYAGNSLVAPEKIRFKFRLEGYDPDWVNAESRRVAYYTNLRPGDYRFHVIACNHHGEWNNIGSAFSFSLAPHFYQTNPFYALCASATVLAGFGLHRLRLRFVRKVQRLEQRHALEVERGRIARDMHDDLGASLAEVAMLSELANRDLERPSEAATFLQRISMAARSSLRAMDEIVWAVNPEDDTFDSLMSYISRYGREYLALASLRCWIDFPITLPDFKIAFHERHEFFLVVKEALHNVVKHAAATEVWIRLTLTSSSFTVCIEDNGQGFSPEQVQGGNGLSNMRTRTSGIGGRFELTSYPGQGTKIKIVMPCRLK